jgi:hypothetical protein
MYRVYIQKGRYDKFVFTGVTENNLEQQNNWRDICAHYGYYAVRFIPDGDSYHLHVAKRHYRKRVKTNAIEHSARPARYRKNRNVPQNC